MNPNPVTAISSKSPRLWNQLAEIVEDCPEKMELLAEALSRKGRPVFGSVTVNLQEGKITTVHKNEVLK